MLCIKPVPEQVRVCLQSQTLAYAGRVFPISSSKFGIGAEEGSNKTPLGHFQISEKFGSGDEILSIYKGRRKCATWDKKENDLGNDMILSRILRLSGMESRNGNTYRRYIYIHGTNDEEGIGSTKSIGCLRMKNEDVIELYNLVPLGASVIICADETDLL